MARVNDQTIIEAWDRQDGLCGLCGEELEDYAYEAHHMKRVADGGTDDVDNIVLLCSREEHLDSHGGNWRNQLETDESFYPFFNGKEDIENIDNLDEEIDLENSITNDEDNLDINDSIEV